MPDGQVGYLYMVTHPEGFVKLGFSVNPRARVSVLHSDYTLLPNHVEFWRNGVVDFTMTLVGVMPGTHEQEKELHRLFRPFRAERTTEWYPADSVAARIIAKLGFEDPDVLLPRRRRPHQKTCDKCGLVMSARELRAHKCGAKQKGGE